MRKVEAKLDLKFPGVAASVADAGYADATQKRCKSGACECYESY